MLLKWVTVILAVLILRSCVDGQLNVNGSEFAMVEFLSSESFPVGVQGALMLLEYFISLNESDAETAPQVIFLFLENWTPDDNRNWLSNYSITSPWAMSRLAGIVSVASYNSLCLVTHMPNFCFKSGCYIPTVVFYNQLDALTVVGLFTGYTLNITVKSFVPNEWKPLCEDTAPQVIIFQVFFAVVYLVAIAIGIVLLIKIKRKGEVRYNFALVCIILEIISNILRFVLIVYDPFSFRGTISIETLHIPFGIVVGILLIFVWQDITRRKTKSQNHPFLSDKFRTPAIVLCCIIGILEVAALVYPLVTPNFDIIYYYLFFMGIAAFFYLCIAFFYFITAIRVYKLLKKLANTNEAKSGSKRSVEVLKLTVKVVASGVGMLLTIAGAIGLLFNDVPTNMFGYSTWNLGLCLTSICTLLAFTPKKGSISGSASKSEVGTSSKPTKSTRQREDTTTIKTHDHDTTELPQKETRVEVSDKHQSEDVEKVEEQEEDSEEQQEDTKEDTKEDSGEQDEDTQEDSEESSA